jgi:hypothetical protein
MELRPAPSWYGQNSLVTSAQGGWVQKSMGKDSLGKYQDGSEASCAEASCEWNTQQAHISLINLMKPFTLFNFINPVWQARRDSTNLSKHKRLSRVHLTLHLFFKI